jgi:uncharacterized protein
MATACTGCGKAISGADVLYTADARVVCPACSGKADLAATQARLSARLGLVAVAGIVAAIPFAVTMSSWSWSVVDGKVSFTYRDWLAIGCGAGAAVLGAIAVVLAIRGKVAIGQIGAASLVMALGGFQIARGLGVFEQPPANAAMSADFRTTGPVQPGPPEPPPDPDDPGACPDQSACFDLGVKLELAKDFVPARTAYERACELGSGRGCHNAAVLWSDAGDAAKGLALWQRDCDHGDQESCANAAVSYMSGEGAAKDLERARTMLTHACDEGEPLGCENLAVMYQDGAGVPADPKKTFELMTKACDLPESDRAASCDAAGVRLLEGKGIKKNPKAALIYFAKACDLAAEHCHDLGVAYDRGLGMKRDPVKAREVYDRACNAGNNSSSCTNLGLMMRKGDGGPKDKAGGDAALQRACDAGVEVACSNLK